MNLVAAFLLGFAGSLHCAAMRGPLILAVQAARGKQRFHNLGYHTGRLATYSLLGGISGLIGAAIVFAGFQRWISIFAGCLILLASVTSFRAQQGRLAGKFVSAAKSWFGRLLTERSIGAAALLGSLNGFLPCGLVYIACAVAAVAGCIGEGIATLLAFGVGTAPILLSIGFAGRMMHWGNPLRVKRVVSFWGHSRRSASDCAGTFAGHSVSESPFFR